MPIAVGGGSSAVRPALRVDVAFTTNPNSPAAADPPWTTLPYRVMTLDFDRSGRTDELALYQPGTATIALLNPDGAFNPVNTSGPYYGMLLPYRPIRVVATYAGIDYTIWQGYAQRWPQTWLDPALGISQIVCVDALTMLNNIGLDSAYAAELLGDNPSVYYPLKESGGSTAGNQSNNDYPPAQIVHTKTVNSTTPGSYQFGGTLDVPAAAAQTGLQFTGTNNNFGSGTEDGYVLTLPQLPIVWSGWTVELWCQIPKTPSQWSVIFRACDALHFAPLSGPTSGDPPGMISLYHNGPASASYLRLTDVAGAGYLDTPINFNLADGNLHHVVIAYLPPVGLSAGTATVYIDGNQVLSAEFSISSTATLTSFIQLGGVAVNAQTLPNSPVQDGRPLIGTVGHLAIYPTTLDIGAVVAHYEAGLGFVGELSGDRAARILAYGGWQPGLQQLQQGRSTMGSASGLSGTSLLTALQNISDTELGTLTVTGNGLVDLRSRDDRILKTTNSLTFGSDITGGEIPFNPQIVFDYDPTLLFNDIQVTRQNGPVAESVDGDSIIQFFPSSKQLTMNLDTDDQAQQAADWVLAREKEPHLRAETLTVNAAGVDGSTHTHVWPGLLGLDLHDRVGIRHRPLGAPEVSMDGFVEQISHHVDAQAQSFAWDVSVQVSPVLQEYGIWDDTASLWDSAIWAF